MDTRPDHLHDEILSALLDGDSGAASDDAAGGPAAHLRSCGRCAGRQADLAAARAALAAAPVEALDELTRRRLVAAALEAGGRSAAPAAPGGPARSGRSRWAARPALIGSVAAVLLGLLVGVPFVVGDNGTPGGDATLSAEAPSTLESAGPFLGDLGDLSQHDRLRLRLTGAGTGAALGYSAPQEPGASPAAGASSPAPVPAAGPAAGGLADPPSARSGTPDSAADRAGRAENLTAGKSTAGQPAEGTRNSATDANAFDESDGRNRAATDACVAALLNGPARGGRLIASGTGTFDGRPAVVVAFELSGGTVAFVADRTGCAVLDRFSL